MSLSAITEALHGLAEKVFGHVNLTEVENTAKAVISHIEETVVPAVTNEVALGFGRVADFVTKHEGQLSDFITKHEEQLNEVVADLKARLAELNATQAADPAPTAPAAEAPAEAPVVPAEGA